MVLVYPSLVLSLFDALRTAFFKSFYDAGSTGSMALSDYLSPIELFASLIDQSGVGRLQISLLAAAFLMSAVLITAALLLYRIYPSEAAGTAIAFPLSPDPESADLHSGCAVSEHAVLRTDGHLRIPLASASEPAYCSTYLRSDRIRLSPGSETAAERLAFVADIDRRRSGRPVHLSVRPVRL